MLLKYYILLFYLSHSFLLPFLFVCGSHPTVLSGYSSPCTQGLFLVELGETTWEARDESRWAVCKANSLLAVLSFRPPLSYL